MEGIEEMEKEMQKRDGEERQDVAGEGREMETG